MAKEINLEWVQDLLANDRKERADMDNGLSKIDWVQVNKNFKKDLKFKVMPANSKENKIFATVIATHWNIGDNNGRILCVEQTPHLKKLGLTCPMCEAKRKLKAMGFKDEDLCTEGKYGPMPIFDPNVTTNVKAVIVGTDSNDVWDKAHISVLQQKGNYLARWLCEKYVDENVPDFLQIDSSNVFEFKRQSDNSKWDRNLSFVTFTPSAEIAANLREENEALCLPDLWPVPSDESFLKVKEEVGKMVAKYENAKKVLSGATDTSDSVAWNNDENFTIDDNIPF